MPLLNLHLLSLSGAAPVFLSILRSSFSPDDIVAVSQPRYLYIPSTVISTQILNNTNWDLLLLLRSTAPLPAALLSLIANSYTLAVGVPSKLLSDYPQHNASLLRTSPSIPLTGALDKALMERATVAKSSGDDLELSGSLLRFMEDMIASGEGSRPMSMLNLLCFREGRREEYMKYGQGFKSAGGRRGGDAKIVGKVADGEKGGEDWDEIAFVHYPSIRHFCDMTAGEDYQDINHKYRLGVRPLLSKRFLNLLGDALFQFRDIDSLQMGSHTDSCAQALKDTLLLCTTETDILGQWRSMKL